MLQLSEAFHNLSGYVCLTPSLLVWYKISFTHLSIRCIAFVSRPCAFHVNPELFTLVNLSGWSTQFLLQNLLNLHLQLFESIPSAWLMYVDAG
jgi:hypothetical protein